MVSDEELRRLKILADQYGIRQKPESDEWPLAHQSLFQSIQDLGQRKFQTYSDAIKLGSDDKPGRRENGSRVEWLVKQASHLSQSAANENTWRIRIESAMLERFSVEIACPKCKDRLWRSEIETQPTEQTRSSKELQQRKRQRKACQCPHEDVPNSVYELGISRIFEQKIEEPVIHTHSTEKLPKQSPDRVVGLAQTTNIGTCLDQPPRYRPDTGVKRLRDLVQCSPHKLQSSPLLFPFLAVEAKSDSAKVSFADIQTQTAFPIWSFLNLQKDLQELKASDRGRPEPLVWFLGYKGPDWKFYGCYITGEPESKPIYNIHYLRGNDITTKDGALQLLLIIDFVMDWARDTFRTSILAQLSSLATGVDFDQVSLGPDSDIISKAKTIQAWNSQVPSTIMHDNGPNIMKAQRKETKLQEEDDDIVIPNTRFGTVRPMSDTILELAGLRINEFNVESLLTRSDWPVHTKPSACARKLMNKLARWDEVLVVLGADLDYIERAWVDQENGLRPFADDSGAEFYAIFEYRCYMNAQSELVRELSYLAISESAYKTLKDKAAYKQQQFAEFASLPRLRPSSGSCLREAVECLLSGSPWQVFCLAMSSTLISLYPMPETIRDDYTPPVTALGLGYLSSVRLRHLIDGYLELTKVEYTQPKQSKRKPNTEPQSKRPTSDIDIWRRKTGDRSFRRLFRLRTRDTGISHDSTQCPRCKASKQDLYELKLWDQENPPSLPAYDAVIVASLKEEKDTSITLGQNEYHDFCLFYTGSPEWLADEECIATVVEDLAQNEAIFHTIRHNVEKDIGEPGTQLWNLPLPYRKQTERQSSDIARWVCELDIFRPPPDGAINVSTYVGHPRTSTSLWAEQQMLLYYLRFEKTYDGAVIAMKKFLDNKLDEYNDGTLWYKSTSRTTLIDPNCVNLSLFLDVVRPKRKDVEPFGGYGMTREKLRLRGDL